MNPLGTTLNSIPSQVAQPGWLDWLQNLRNGPPLQPVDGVPISSAYQQMPAMTAPITDLRGAGPSTWMSRPHDQNIGSRNLGGYVDPKPLGGPDYQWRKVHGYEQDFPTTPLADPDFIPSDPEIMGRIRAKEYQDWANDPRNTDRWGG